MGVKWLKWTEKNLQRAQIERKPILLSISATWCHWCHVMDSTTYQNKTVHHTIQSDFIPIRADTDLRPDVNGRYNTGGWPTTTILNNAGKTLAGAQYLDARKMLKFLEQGKRIYTKQANSPPVPPPQPTLTDKTPMYDHKALMKSHYDPINHGFGVAPKYPDHELHDLLLFEGSKTSIQMLTATLRAIAQSELHDKEDGGFYRYATQADWSLPHYEKLLIDNAQLLTSYTLCYQKTRQRFFRTMATNLLKFLNEFFWNRTTGYFHSIAADEEYCNLSLKQRRAHPAPPVNELITTDANAEMARALLTYSQVFAHRPCATRAHTVIENLLKNTTTLGARHTSHRSSPYTLDDSTRLLRAMKISNNKMIQQKSTILEEAIIKTYYDPAQGGFFDLPRKGFGLLSTPYKDYLENMRCALAIASPTHAEQTYKLWASSAGTYGAYSAAHARLGATVKSLHRNL